MWHKSNEQEMCLSSTMYESTLSTKESLHVSYPAFYSNYADSTVTA